MDEKHYQEIIGLLKTEQDGLTIEEISKRLSMSRITAAKYLSSLFASGQVNMRKFGPAKLYTLSTRLPAEMILSQSSDPILILDESYTVREVSDSFLRVFGIDRIRNRDINETSLGPSLIDRIRDPVREGISGKEAVVNVWIPVQREWKAFRIRIIPLAFGWADRGVVIMFEDRTDEVMAQEENDFLAGLINASPAVIAVHDMDGNFLYSNRKDLGLEDVTLTEFLLENVSQGNDPEDHHRILGCLERLKRTGETSFEFSHYHDGQKVPLEVREMVTRWRDRDVIVSVATDISERKAAENMLRERERRLSDIIDFLPDATVVVDGSGTIIAWNRAMEEMTGVKARDIVGDGLDAYRALFYGDREHVLLDLVTNDDPAVRKKYRNFRKEGRTLTAETVVNIPGKGERYVWLKASPFLDKEGKVTGTIESIRDITGFWREGGAGR